MANNGSKALLYLLAFSVATNISNATDLLLLVAAALPRGLNANIRHLAEGTKDPRRSGGPIHLHLSNCQQI